MNMSATQSPPPAPPRTDSRDSSSRAAPKESTRNHSARDDFERALQSREQLPESTDEAGEQSDEGQQQSNTGDGGAAAWMASLPAPLPLRAAAMASPVCAGAMPAEVSGTRAVIEASLATSPGQAVTPVTGIEPAALWEVSVGATNAVPLQLRAERTGTEAQRAWGLTIASPAANTEMLVRHAPRLNERLRKHAIELSHVRVEQADEDETT